MQRHQHGVGEGIVHIVFLPGETDDQQRWVVWFPAVVEGRPITCGMSYQALRDHFAADFFAPMSAFLAHRSAIEQVTARFIAQSQCEDDDTVLMRSQDVRGLQQ